ncbi:MAG TPA: EcsC family protein [Ktedonobacterales bacterium]|nr:EcsC family protein [Ktedonobacterales bacterium]
MTSSGNPGGASDVVAALGSKAIGNLKSQLTAQAIQALPPEIQDILKPGKQSDRINRAIGWAARRDQTVIQLHQRHGAKGVTTLEEIRNLPLKQDDEVAQHIAARYRGRALLTGAVTGLPGGLWALVAAGLDVQMTAIYAVRMASGIAQAYGYDTTQPEELAQLAEVLALVAGVDSLRGIGNWLTREGLMVMLPQVLPRVLAKVGAEITKEQAAKTVGRLVPGVGAVIGGAIDYSFLRVAGDRAIQFYHHRYMVDHGMIPATLALPPGHAIAAMPAGTGQTLMPGVAMPTTMPALPHSAPKRREKSPERLGVYLAIFAVFTLLITILACAALIVIIEASLGNIHLPTISLPTLFVGVLLSLRR